MEWFLCQTSSHSTPMVSAGFGDVVDASTRYKLPHTSATPENVSNPKMIA